MMRNAHAQCAHRALSTRESNALTKETPENFDAFWDIVNRCAGKIKPKSVFPAAVAIKLVAGYIRNVQRQRLIEQLRSFNIFGTGAENEQPALWCRSLYGLGEKFRNGGTHEFKFATIYPAHAFYMRFEQAAVDKLADYCL